MNIVTLSYFQAGSRGTQARPRAACMGSEQVVVFTFLVVIRFSTVVFLFGDSVLDVTFFGTDESGM